MSRQLLPLIQIIMGVGVYGLYLVFTRDTVIRDIWNIIRRRR